MHLRAVTRADTVATDDIGRNAGRAAVNVCNGTYDSSNEVYIAVPDDTTDTGVGTVATRVGLHAQYIFILFDIHDNLANLITTNFTLTQFTLTSTYSLPITNPYN